MKARPPAAGGGPSREEGGPPEPRASCGGGTEALKPRAGYWTRKGPPLPYPATIFPPRRPLRRTPATASHAHRRGAAGFHAPDAISARQFPRDNAGKMLRHASMVLVILLLEAVLAAQSIDAQSFDARAVEREGIALFGDGRWEAARERFSRLEAWLDTKPAGARNFDKAYRQFSWTALCEEAAALAASPPAPRIHRLLVLVPLRSGFSWRGGEFSGEFGAAELDTVELPLKAAARVVWVLSGGAWSWDYREQPLDASLGALSSDASGDEWRFLQASPLDPKPYPSRLPADTAGSLDTLVMYRNSAGVRDARGSVPTG